MPDPPINNSSCNTKPAETSKDVKHNSISLASIAHKQFSLNDSLSVSSATQSQPATDPSCIWNSTKTGNLRAAPLSTGHKMQSRAAGDWGERIERSFPICPVRMPSDGLSNRVHRSKASERLASLSEFAVRASHETGKTEKGQSLTDTGSGISVDERMTGRGSGGMGLRVPGPTEVTIQTLFGPSTNSCFEMRCTHPLSWYRIHHCVNQEGVSPESIACNASSRRLKGRFLEFKTQGRAQRIAALIK